MLLKCYIQHVSKVMLELFQTRFQEYVNWDLPEVQARIRKGGGTRDQIANIHWIVEKPRKFQKNIYFCFTDYTKAFVWITTNCGKFLEMGVPDHVTCLLRNLYMRVKKQQLKRDMEQCTGSKLAMEYNNAVYCCLVYLIYMQNTLPEMPG